MERRTLVIIGASAGVVVLVAGLVVAVVLRRRAMEAALSGPSGGQQAAVNGPQGGAQAAPKEYVPVDAQGKPLEAIRAPGGGTVFSGTPATLPPTGDDRDSDGLTNEEEAKLGTNPDNHDTDGDGLYDGDEVNKYHTDPLKADSDGNGTPDGKQIRPAR